MQTPNIIIAGATRGGLRTLMDILGSHPQIFAAKRKEHSFFHQEKILQNIGSFQFAFEDAVHPDYKERIPKERILHLERQFDPALAFKTCPQAKVIFTLRNPTERAYDQYTHAVSMNKERARNFETAIEEELIGHRRPENHSQCWLYKNHYQIHIEEWLKYFPKKRLHLLILEEWINPNNNTFRTLESFLGLEPRSLQLDYELEIEQKSKQVPMLVGTRRRLENIFSVDRAYIENYIGRRVSAWEDAI